MPSFINLTGRVFGRLTVIKRGSLANNGQIKWICECECGKRKEILGASFKNGKTQSCGCLHAERTSEAKTTHGASHTPEYEAWLGMKRRCNDPDREDFKNYGGRGIKICPEWDTFEQFLNDMGPRPSALHSIDRVKNELGYSKDNCKWATRSEQSRNKRTNSTLDFQGKTLCLQDWAKLTGIGGSTISYRTRRGWPVERILTKPGRVVSIR